jgi:hypothetical protein
MRGNRLEWYFLASGLTSLLKVYRPLSTKFLISFFSSSKPSLVVGFYSICWVTAVFLLLAYDFLKGAIKLSGLSGTGILDAESCEEPKPAFLKISLSLDTSDSLSLMMSSVMLSCFCLNTYCKAYAPKVKFSPWLGSKNEKESSRWSWISLFSFFSRMLKPPFLPSSLKSTIWVSILFLRNFKST